MDRPRQLPLPLPGAADPEQLESRSRPAPRTPGAPRLSLIQGEGQARNTVLHSRDDLARVLVGAAGDMLLRRISAPRASEIQRKVERLLALFDRVDREPLLEKVLRRELDGLEALVRESQGKPRSPR